MADTRFERLKAKLMGRMPVVETPKVDWVAVIQATHKRLYSGSLPKHIPLIRSGREGFKRG